MEVKRIKAMPGSLSDGVVGGGVGEHKVM